MNEQEIERLKAENEALRQLYTSLLDFGQDSKLPLERYDYIKARVFDTTVLLNRARVKFGINENGILG
jgi:hypothetical protein